jgi:hypothetical protein
VRGVGSPPLLNATTMARRTSSNSAVSATKRCASSTNVTIPSVRPARRGGGLQPRLWSTAARRSA